MAKLAKAGKQLKQAADHESGHRHATVQHWKAGSGLAPMQRQVDGCSAPVAIMAQMVG